MMLTFLLNILRLIANCSYYLLGYIRASFMGVKILPGARISPFASIKGCYSIGKAFIGKKVKLGNGSYISSGYIFSGIVGDYCSIGYDVIIGPSEHDLNSSTTSPICNYEKSIEENSKNFLKPPPTIGDHVWIGARVIILKGVTIGKGAVVGAGAVVTKNIPENEIWVGVPARKLRKR